MSLPQRQTEHTPSPQDRLRADLARGNAVLARIGPILGHLLATSDHSLFSDEVVARVRGMLHDLAGQVLRAQAEATGEAAREEFAQRHGEVLAAQFLASPALLGHCHALAIEWQLTTRLEAQAGLDPVLSPLVQDLIASPESAVASAAMAALAAQARFAQAQRRMELPLTELPGDLFHEALLAWRTFSGPERSDAMVRAEARLRNAYDEGSGRIALFARLFAGMGAHAGEALAPDRAGVPLFLAALASRSAQSRELAALSTNERQIARLALGLRAANLSEGAATSIVLVLNPETSPPLGLDSLSRADAQQLLAQSGWVEGR